MVDLAKRRWFNLKTDQAKTSTVMRPPWAVAEAKFVDACSRCGECIKACPQKIIKQGSGQFPELDFQLGECDFCQACVKACPTKALDISVSPAIRFEPQINKSCLAEQAIYCKSCAESCPSNAIVFRYIQSSIAVPQLNNDLCNQCGACVAPCPTNAIQFIHVGASHV